MHNFARARGHERQKAVLDHSGAEQRYAAFYEMAAKLGTAMDSVNGDEYMANFLALMSEDVVVCFPFVGKIANESCYFGKEAVAAAGRFGNQTAAYINLEVDAFWVAEPPNESGIAGVWRYTQTSVFARPSGKVCSVQWHGSVVWNLNPANTSQVSQWLESPDAGRYARTFPYACFDD